MAFLVLAPAYQGLIDSQLLCNAAGDIPIAWFETGTPDLGGFLCLSPLTVVRHLTRGDQLDCKVVGRIRLDRRTELQAKLAGTGLGGTAKASDADLCLHAYAKWGDQLINHLYGEFCFVIYDSITRKLICARDHFGVRTLAWYRDGNAVWIAGSMRDLVSIPSFNARELDRQWIADFLRVGNCSDPARSAYSEVHRLPPAHTLTVSDDGPSVRRYWRLLVEGPVLLQSPEAYAEEFHDRLNAAMRDRLPTEAVGVSMSGGLDSSTLAAKAVQLGGAQFQVFANTWLAGGASDPEAQASTSVAEHLGLQHTMIDGDRLRFDPNWQEKPADCPEPSMRMIDPDSRRAEAEAMRLKASCWFYGEGPDNALTFEWQMHLRWLVQHQHWALLPGAIASYWRSKSFGDWRTSASSRLRLSKGGDHFDDDHRWVLGGSTRAEEVPDNDWRPEAHSGLSSALWPAMFEELDAEFAPVAIDWRHPYMDLRVVEFLLQTPPIPWARNKLLIRQAMKGRLPIETLSRAKKPLHRDVLAELLVRHLTTMPPMDGAIDDFVDVAKLPKQPASHSGVYPLLRVAILNHWLKTRHG